MARITELLLMLKSFELYSYDLDFIKIVTGFYQTQLKVIDIGTSPFHYLVIY